ncbi:hypothetical protein [Massilia sp. TWP1-3-3]|uniref:hypothetical protein n=1 Tax=Massilia sp. TWP1-3-3 TaxID=2804573 RepID=UPI003CEDE427
MKTFLKSLLVWLLLLAVPFQGFAAATMLVCAPLSSPAFARAAAPEADVGTGLTGDQSEHCAEMAGAPGDDSATDKSGHHADTKCNSCASCHVGAAIASSDVNRIQLETQQFFSSSFDLGFVAAVDLALPERPPQARRS